MPAIDEDYTDLPQRKGLSLGRRIELLERDVLSHASSLGQIATQVNTLGLNLSELIEWRVDKRVSEAREEERDKALELRLKQMEDNFSKGFAELSSQVKEIKGFGTRVFWLVVATVIPAMVLGVAVLIVLGPQLVQKIT